MKRGVSTEVRPARVPENPLPLLHVPVGGVEPELDEDEKAVREYAEQHPQEDAEEEEVPQPRSSEQGGAVVEAQDAVQVFQQEMALEEQHAREKRAAERTELPIPVRQRVAEVEAAKRAQHPEEEEGSQAKFVKFDPNTEIIASSPEQPRTGLYSPTYAGEISQPPAKSSSSTSGNVRRVVDELELYEDEMDFEIPEGSWDWELCEDDGGFDESMVSISEDQRRRGFDDEGAGPPEVSPEELAWLDAEAMQLELDRLRDLDVIGSVDAGVDLDECIKLDTRLVRDWRFRDSR